ncbi:MAG: hypothetical protein HQM02_11945, partial [Magnetococcales bacterium]|nr:hypothetical protein [Magnetococcales bacterium]
MTTRHHNPVGHETATRAHALWSGRTVQPLMLALEARILLDGAGSGDWLPHDPTGSMALPDPQPE